MEDLHPPRSRCGGMGWLNRQGEVALPVVPSALMRFVVSCGGVPMGCGTGVWGRGRGIRAE